MQRLGINVGELFSKGHVNVSKYGSACLADSWLNEELSYLEGREILGVHFEGMVGVLLTMLQGIGIGIVIVEVDARWNNNSASLSLLTKIRKIMTIYKYLFKN